MRKRMMSVALAVVAVVAYVGAPGARTLCEGFLPENNLQIPIGAAEAKGITQDQFNKVLDRVQALYGPVVASKGGTLQINRLWDNATVNASAQRNGNTYVLNMYGGLARHKTITQDGFALVACHEMGHHIGGFPKIKGWMNSWASNEGQSDYFANMKCLRRVFADPGSAEFTRMDANDDFAAEACAKTHKGAQDAAICLRGAQAGMSVAALFQELRKEPKGPSFSTPDPSVVSKTNDAHPGTQCRMDTYFQGSLCSKPVSEEVSDSDPRPGACTRTEGFSAGIRPLCWYKPEAGMELEASVIPADSTAFRAKSKSLQSLETAFR